MLLKKDKEVGLLLGACLVNFLPSARHTAIGEKTTFVATQQLLYTLLLVPKAGGFLFNRAGILTHPTTEGLPGIPVAQSSGLFRIYSSGHCSGLVPDSLFIPSNQSDRRAT